MKYTLLIGLFILSLPLLGQEEDYYKALQQRQRNYEVRNLPNLDSRFSTFYVGVSGALRKPFIGMEGDFNRFGSTNNSVNEWIELNGGINFNNSYFVEMGIVSMKNQMNTYVFASPYNPGFTLGTRNRQLYVPVVFKKRVLNFNRITNNAYLNLGGGLGFLVNSKPELVENARIDIQEGIQSPLLSHFFVTLDQSSSPIYGELSMEIKGNITERLEILAFVKGVFREQKYMSNSYEVVLAGGNTVHKYAVFEKSASLVFGIQVRFNSRKFLRYSSII